MLSKFPSYPPGNDLKCPEEENGVVLFSPDTVIGNGGGFGSRNASSWESCSRMCSDERNCSFYAYLNESSICYLQRKVLPFITANRLCAGKEVDVIDDVEEVLKKPTKKKKSRKEKNKSRKSKRPITKVVPTTKEVDVTTNAVKEVLRKPRSNRQLKRNRKKTAKPANKRQLKRKRKKTVNRVVVPTKKVDVIKNPVKELLKKTYEQ